MLRNTSTWSFKQRLSFSTSIYHRYYCVVIQAYTEYVVLFYNNITYYFIIIYYIIYHIIYII